MEREMEPTFSAIGLVGVIVRDVDRAIKYLSSLGIGPFEPLHTVWTGEKNTGGGTFINRKRWGKPFEGKDIKIGLAQVGPVQLELIQPLGRCAEKDFLEEKGEGIYHIAFIVKDLDKSVAELTKQGVAIVESAESVGGGGFAFLDTEAGCGIRIALIQYGGRDS